MTLTKEFLESDVEIRNLPVGYRLLGALAGIPVVEDHRIAYDEMYPGEGSQGIVVGETRHFLYRMKMLDLNEQCRAAARQNIEDTAWRILGEHWRMSY